MARRQRIARLVIALMASTALPSFALAVEASGTTVMVDPAANASGPGGDRILEVDGAIFTGDEVKTDRGGEAQIRFRDDTRLVVGPNSRILIDKFVFNPDQSVKQVGIDLVKGAFRFVSGNGPKQAYAIRTPTMTIGIRGTEFDVAVRGGGETTFALYSGGARVCDAGGVCVELDGGCSVVVAPPGGGLNQVAPGQQRSQTFKSFFPYVKNQSGLATPFRLNTSGCGRDGTRAQTTPVVDEEIGDNQTRDAPRASPPSPPDSQEPPGSF